MAWLRAHRELWAVVGISALIGGTVGLLVTDEATRGLLQGALSGVLISLAARLTGRLLERTELQRRTFGTYLALSAVVNVSVIVAALAAAALPWAFTEGVGDLRTYGLPFAVACAASLAFTAWFGLDRLLGRDVLVGLLTGRYHHPRVEERIFLFADVADSTALAERLGELRFHAFLNRLWTDLAVAVERHGGTIHRYIGDQLEVTWTLERGRLNADCVRCARALLDTVTGASLEYTREFDVQPRLRLALHAGPVVVGELGASKREIAYSGDTLNTISRIEVLGKELGAEIVVSGDLLRGLDLPTELVARPLGSRRLRGKQREVELFAVEPATAGYQGGMAARRVLVVATDIPDERGLRERLREEIPDGAEVRVVSPATKVSALDWLTGDEDDARAEAAEAAERTAEALGGETQAEVDRTSQSTDAAENVRDALRLFSPDEVVVVTDDGEDDTWLEDDAVREALQAPGVPVRRVRA